MNKFRVELGFSPLDEKALFGNRVTGAKLLTSVTPTWQELCELLAGTISPWYDPGVHDPVKASVCRCLFSATNNWTLFGLIFLELAPLWLQAHSVAWALEELSLNQNQVNIQTPMFANNFFPSSLVFGSSVLIFADAFWNAKASACGRKQWGSQIPGWGLAAVRKLNGGLRKKYWSILICVTACCTGATSWSHLAFTDTYIKKGCVGTYIHTHMYTYVYIYMRILPILTQSR